MKTSHAPPEAAGLPAPCTPGRRCLLVAVAGLLCAAAPGKAGAADLAQLANLADQVQQAAWSQAAGAGVATRTAQTPTVDVAKTVAQVTHAALASADPAAATAVVHETVAAATGGEPAAARRAPPRVQEQEAPRAQAHKKARPRVAAAAASPLPVPPPARQMEPRAATETPVSTRDARDRDGGKQAAPPPRTARDSRTPSSPFRLPPLPFPFAMPSSVGVGAAGGPLVPALVVALVAALLLFCPEVSIRRVPSRRPARPSRIVLPPWRPG